MKKQKPIAIICAMNVEVKQMIYKLGEVTLIEIGNKFFYKGFYREREIIVAKCGIGKVNASITTTILIREFDPEYIINCGVAGGYAQHLKTCDVVVADKLFYYDVDVTFNETDIKYGQIPDENPFFTCSSLLIEMLTEEKNDLHLEVGSIMTSDQFATDRSYLDKIVSQYFSDENMLAVDMESTSIAQTANCFNIPIIIIRSISDVVGISQEQTYDNFLERACHNASVIVSILLEKLSNI